MTEDINLKNIGIILFFVIIVLAVIYVPKLFDKDNSDNVDRFGNDFELKSKYGVNEYIPIMISDEQMAKKYLIDYINQIIYDINGSYKLLDKDYREERFGNAQIYIDYINSLNLSSSTLVDRYAVDERTGYKYYYVYDKEGHLFIFKTKGVMQYEVYFDDIDAFEEGDEE